MCVQRELKSQKLAHKLVWKFSQRFISPPKETEHCYEEKALHILSLARVKNKIHQVRGSNYEAIYIYIYIINCFTRCNYCVLLLYVYADGQRYGGSEKMATNFHTKEEESSHWLLHCSAIL